MLAIEQMVLYYDHEMHARDGCGWCIDFLRGTHCYRFPDITDACQFIEEHSKYLKEGGRNDTKEDSVHRHNTTVLG